MAWSRTRVVCAAVAGLLLAAVVLLAAADGMMCRRLRRAGRGGVLDEGLVLYDTKLGWRLAPSWRGGHRRRDFAVSYSTTREGLRSSARDHREATGSRILFVGDGCTFGMGVNDNETFVECLNAGDAYGNVYLNMSVPGFSTDQECLLIEEQALKLRPARVVLVVSLTDDTIDSIRAFPVQTDRGKPFFEIRSGGLVLCNTPVPLTRKPAEAPRDLEYAVLGGRTRSLWEKWVERSPLLARAHLSEALSRPTDVRIFDETLGPGLELFEALVRRAAGRCADESVGFSVILLAGRAHALRPDQLAAQYQEYLREHVVRRLAAAGIECFDLAAGLRAGPSAERESWFYPNEGHLTPAGHRTVAERLRREAYWIP